MAQSILQTSKFKRSFDFPTTLKSWFVKRHTLRVSMSLLPKHLDIVNKNNDTNFNKAC